MKKHKITYKTSSKVSPNTLRAFLRRNQWQDWFTSNDIKYYLRKALYVTTAWHGRKIVGLAVLTGDGKNDVFIDSLVVDCSYQKQGIGTTLMEMLLAKAMKLKPYHLQAQIFDRHVDRFYKKFGFVNNKATWLLEHKRTADNLRAKVKLIRKLKDI